MAQKYRIIWCDLCNTYSAGCPDPKCHGSSCNCGGCKKCLKDLEDFKKLHPRPDYYMTKEEQKIVEKYYRLKSLLKTCLVKNQSGLDLEWCYYNGKFCDNDWELLDLKFERYNIAWKKYPKKFPFLKL